MLLRNYCNLIPSSCGTQHLSSKSDHWTISLHRGFLFKGLFQKCEERFDDPQLLPRVVGSWLDLKRLPFAWELGFLFSRQQGINYVRGYSTVRSH